MKKILIIVATISILAACSDSENGKKSKEDYQAAIDKIEAERAEYFKTTGLPPKELVLESIQTYEFFVADYPKDEKAGGYLFEAAKRYDIDMQDYKNAIRLYQQVYDEYDDYKHHEMALFHVANAYHSMGSYGKATSIFKEFIIEYPDHDFADDAQGMINIIKMGGEEAFLKSLLEKDNKEDSIVG